MALRDSPALSLLTANHCQGGSGCCGQVASGHVKTRLPPLPMGRVQQVFGCLNLPSHIPRAPGVTWALPDPRSHPGRGWLMPGLQPPLELERQSRPPSGHAHNLGQPFSSAGLSQVLKPLCCMFGTVVPALLCSGKSGITSGLQSHPPLACPPTDVPHECQVSWMQYSAASQGAVSPSPPSGGFSSQKRAPTSRSFSSSLTGKECACKCMR